MKITKKVLLENEAEWTKRKESQHLGSFLIFSSYPSTKKEARKRIVVIAQEILNKQYADELDLAKKIVEMDCIRSSWFPDFQDDVKIDDLLSIFLVVEDCFDDDGVRLDDEARKLWNSDYLKELDKKMSETIKFYKKNILEACRDILKKYEK